jgi:uncharacterized membrane protein
MSGITEIIQTSSRGRHRHELCSIPCEIILLHFFVFVLISGLLTTAILELEAGMRIVAIILFIFTCFILYIYTYINYKIRLTTNTNGIIIHTV